MRPKDFLLLLFISIESNGDNDERESINNIEFVTIKILHLIIVSKY